MIALTLSALEFQRLGFDPNLGVDMHFFNKANADAEADCLRWKRLSSSCSCWPG